MKSELTRPEESVPMVIRARRWPFVATILISLSRSSHRTPFRIGRLSSVETANEVCWMRERRSVPRRPPRFAEVYLWQGGELVGRKPVELEAASTALQLDLITSGRHCHRLVGKLAGDLLQLLPGRGEGPLLLHVRRDLYAHGDVQIRAAHPDAVVSCLEQDVGQDWKCGLRRNARRDGRQAVVEILSGAGEFHLAPPGVGSALEIHGSSFYF